MLATLSLLKHYSNWYIILLDHFGVLFTTHLVIQLRNHIAFKARTGGSDAGVVNEIWVKNHYDPPGYETRNGDVVVDIGAHIGAFSVLAARAAPDVAVFSFEPFPDSFVLLEDNLERNRINDVQAFQLAVSGRSGTQELYGPASDTTGHTLRVYGTDSVNVQCLTIAEVFTSNRIDVCHLLKMDCEGSEYDIFFNTPDELFQRIQRVIIEYHPHVNYEPEAYSGEGLCALLERHGFVLEPIARPIDPRSSGLIYGRRAAV